MVGVSTHIQPVIVPKVHCSREGLLYFKSNLYFFLSPHEMKEEI